MNAGRHSETQNVHPNSRIHTVLGNMMDSDNQQRVKSFRSEQEALETDSDRSEGKEESDRGNCMPRGWTMSWKPVADPGFS